MGAVLGLIPLATFLILFLLLPAVSVIGGSFSNPGGGIGFDAYRDVLREPYRSAFLDTVALSAITSVAGGAIGVLIARWITQYRRLRWLRRPVTAASAVLTYFGGVPLAFIFIATIGTTGVITRALDRLGFSLYGHGFSLYSFTGLGIVYLYVQAPLMVILVLPAMDGLQKRWEDAAVTLGATRRQYWRRVALPVLTPALLGGVLILFANAFSGYATAYALTAGSLPLVPIEIGSVLAGDLPGQQNLGDALGVTMILVMLMVLVAYYRLQARAALWLR